VNFQNVYHNNDDEKYGPTVDGGLFSFNPPKIWTGETIAVSPWGEGNLNMNPTAKFLDIAIPSFSTLENYYKLGINQGKSFLKYIYKS